MQGVNWYENSRREVQSRFGNDSDMFLRILAATSIGMSLDANVTLALRAYHQLQCDGRLHESSFMRVQRDHVNSMLNGMTHVGRKVASFYANLAGNEEIVTVDRWMQRYCNSKDYDECASIITDEAKLRSLAPAQWQAHVWCDIRGDATSYTDVLKRREVYPENLTGRLL